MATPQAIYKIHVVYVQTNRVAMHKNGQQPIISVPEIIFTIDKDITLFFISLSNMVLIRYQKNEGVLIDN